VRQDLVQLNEKLHQQTEYANNLLIQCGIDSSYALTQVWSNKILLYSYETFFLEKDNATLLIKGEKFHHDDLIWNDRQAQIWRWYKTGL
jgi:hypothetical protein